ncbi:MAG: serine hydrolase [Bifidobacteriaceae bacterium]|jgi:CubicO group peptidase (beta-lactamase class C family)|nr:serine hydrolase [Bifidobacteriaceae bacterium]
MNASQPLDRAQVLSDMVFHRVPGTAAALIRDGEVVFLECYGHRDLKKTAPITEKTLFGIASNSKSFTSALIAALVDEGKLEYDRPVKEYVPEFKMMDPVATQGVTLRDMLCHRTGLAPHDGLWIGDSYGRAELLRRLAYLEPSAPFRQGFAYNNTVYTLAGHVAERVTGLSWDDLIRERFFGPLGFEDSTTSIKDFGPDTDYALPHYLPEGQDDAVELPMRNVDIGAPCAGINASVRDLARWVVFQMGDGAPGGQRIISTANLNAMHNPGMVMGEGLPWDMPWLPDRIYYGLGWFNDYYRGHRHVWHAGEINGYNTFMGFLPKAGVGYALLTNRHKPNTPFCLAQIYTMLDRALALEPFDWSGAMRRAARSPVDGAFHFPHTFDLLAKAPVADAPLSHAPADYAGTYVSQGYGDLVFTHNDGTFTAEWRAEEFAAEHYHYDTFKVLRVLEDVNWWSLPLEFVTDPYTGEVSKALFKLEPTVSPIEFVKE